MKLKALLIASVSALALVAMPTAASADVAPLSTHSWDPGLHATASASSDSVHAWGMRQTAGAWGTGPVNYQAGATTKQVGASSGTLDVTLKGTYCPGGVCSYGAGSGYRGSCSSGTTRATSSRSA